MSPLASNLKALPERIRQSVVVDISTGCWLWQAHKTAAGYGQISVGNKQRYVHRLAYEALVGPIVNQLDHLCRVRHCCNTAHLEDVTQRENLLRGKTVTARNAAATHCPLGHPYDEANTHITVRGTRACKACSRMKAAAYLDANRDEGNARRRKRYSLKCQENT